ncbi:VanW family protein [Anaerocolumna xylanovorans]|uniref:Vancomycin resistance protein YoaR, contains peptidoglycan-binding and VanW domains n=1 Tax=Anaerocolumna xylanovorans DSM 12503 TaxID=1121345 RepID=A0A1M7Y6L2_9FIRM|nr:VanW family protein [Anaerocolumna xylanovorans]SHO48272.1 Vancomycin resistance protein YoaR, contains peptidoglycan-binding and VanW domains [Anaerocolumna xylanovorans DSM 12503]
MNYGKRMVRIVLFLLSLFLLSAGNFTKVLAAGEEDVITKGVYIDTVDIGGMTKEEAEKAVADYVDTLKQKNVTVDIKGEKEQITVGDLGFASKENNYIEEAVEIGKTGNLIKQYKELKDTQENKITYHMEYSIDETKLKSFAKKKLSGHNVKAVNATVTRKNGDFVYTDETVGQKVDTKTTMAAIEDAILNNWTGDNIGLTAKVDETQPKYTREMVEKCNTVLGSFQTTYATSTSDRAANLANGARLINNTVLYPGEVFSAYDKLAPFTTQNGYYQAGAYSNGKLVDSIGGGACQVTTTLYNAVLLSELEVVERSSHSMTISYVDLSRDAAIAGTWKNLRFKNNTDAPIVVEATTYGRTIYFKIWGHETRDTENRKIKFETVILNEKQPGGDVVTKDPNQPTTYEYTTQSAHIGYTAELYKIVYEDGVEVSRTRVNRSVYNASPRYVTVGTKKIEEPDKNAADDKKGKDKTKTSSEDPEEVPVWTGNENSGSTDGNKANNKRTGTEDDSGDSTQEDDTGF